VEAEFEFLAGPELDSVIYKRGSLIDNETSSFSPDTLKVKFSTKVEQIDHSKPFLFYDEDDAKYQYRLDYLSTDGRWVTFEVIGVSGKSEGYLPKHNSDHVQIDVSKEITGTDGTAQFDTDNEMVPMAFMATDKHRIATPEADPSSGNTQEVSQVKISVAYPSSDLYEIRYTTDGSDVESSSQRLEGETISLPSAEGNDIVLKVVAYSKDTDIWMDSDPLEVTYEYVGGPIMDSAVYAPGGLADFETSEVLPDTLTIYFNEETDEISPKRPFISHDADGNEYRFVLENEEGNDDNGDVHTYIVHSTDGKQSGYLPENMSDSITIDPSASVTSSSSGIRQDETTSPVPLRVKNVPSDLTFASIWFDRDDDKQEELAGILNEFSFDEGSLLIIDPRARLNDADISKYKTSMVAFDMLGNQVLDLPSLNEQTNLVEVKVLTISGRQQIAILWSAKNRDGRRVGSASYLMNLSITDHIGNHIVEKIMVMVPR